MRFFAKILKGMLIGVSIVIPGVSGGSMAMSMGIYDQIIHFITASEGFWKKGRLLVPYALGCTLGVLVFSYFIELLFRIYPFQTACVFIGLILGALPMLAEKVRNQRFRASHAAILIGTISLMVLMTIAGSNADGGSELNPTIQHALLAVVLGMVSSGTMIVPGLSGSMMLMLLGYFEPVLQTVNAFSAALVQLDIMGILQSMVIMGPFVLGVILGAVVMARGIRSLMKHFPLATHYGIIGLVIASPFAVLYQQSLSGGITGIAAGTWVVGIGLIATGFVLAMLLGKGDA